MTKNKKIKLLINDNKRLMDENKRLHKLGSEELGNQIISEMEKYSDVIEKLNEQYIELDRLRATGIRNKWRYKLMFMGLRARKVFGV